MSANVTPAKTRNGADVDGNNSSASHGRQGVGVVDRAQRVLHARSTLGPTIVLLAAIAVFATLSPRFLQADNLSLILQQTAVIGTLSAGQTLIILTAGIDLSVGAIMVLTSVVAAGVSVKNGVPGTLALFVGLAVAVGCSLCNGLLVTRLRLPPFIVTLGALNVFFALNLWYSQSATINGLDAPLLWTGSTFSFLGTNVTYGSVLMIVVFCGVAFVLGKTAFGRHIYAIGDDPEAARLTGININRALLGVYVLAGVIYAMGAWIQVGRLSSASPQVGITYNLDTITAVVIGGTSLFGGRGRIFGTLVGALIVTVFRNGLGLAGTDVLWQDFTVGILVIAAVAMDRWVRRVRA